MDTEVAQPPVKPEQIDWPGIFTTNWHKIFPNDVKSFEAQVRFEVWDLKQGEIAAVIMDMANSSKYDKKQPPRPKMVAAAIRSKRLNASPEAQHGMSNFDFEAMRRQMFELADAGEYAAVSDLMQTVKDWDVRNNLGVQIKKHCPAFRYVWPDHLCEMYETLRGKRCPHWADGHAPKELAVVQMAGPLIESMKKKPVETAKAAVGYEDVSDTFGGSDNGKEDEDDGAPF